MHDDGQQDPNDKQPAMGPGGRRRNPRGVGMAIGISIGCGIGIATDRLAVGIGLGVVAGTLIGAMIKRRQDASRDS